jgi:hypothetical protein
MPDNPAMHILIPFAAPAGPQCQEAIGHLQLPHLSELISLLTPAAQWQGTPEALTPLHERVRAQSLGVVGEDGLLPWAAADAHQLGLTKAHGDDGWAWITPCHWKVHADHVAMSDTHQLDLSGEESEALKLAMAPYFAEDGITLHMLAHDTWLAFGDVFKKLPTASLSRVQGTKVDPWMPRQPQARPLRRLQNEMQMLLYTHPVNEPRIARGKLAVNSFWVSGTGKPSTASRQAVPALPISQVDTLQAAALRDDASAWIAAWHTLDASTLRDLLPRAKASQPLQLTLCGERQAHSFTVQSGAWWNRVQRRFTAPEAVELLKTL